MEKLEKLVRADNAQDYRTFCREIGPSEGLLRQSDYGGRRVSMEKKRGKKEKKISDTKQRGRVNVERGIRWGRVFPGWTNRLPLARSLAQLGVHPPSPLSPSFLVPLSPSFSTPSSRFLAPSPYFSHGFPRSLVRSNKSFPWPTATTPVEPLARAGSSSENKKDKKIGN